MFILIIFSSFLHISFGQSHSNNIFVYNEFAKNNGPPISCLGTISMAVGVLGDHPTDWPIKLDQARIYIQNLIEKCLDDQEMDQNVREWMKAKKECPDMLNNGNEPKCPSLIAEAQTVIQQLANVTKQNLHNLVQIRSQKLADFMANCSASANVKEDDIRDFIVYLRGIQLKCNPNGAFSTNILGVNFILLIGLFVFLTMSNQLIFL